MSEYPNGHRPEAAQEEAARAASLRARLLEDAASAEEAEALWLTVQQLRRWEAPTPTEEQRAALLEALLPALPAPRSRLAAMRARLADWWPGLLLRAQMRVVQREIWVGSALMMVLGLLVTVASPGVAGLSTVEHLPFVLLAPVVAALGVAFLYGPLVDPALEIELATAVSPRLVLLARLTLLFGFDLALGLAGSVVLAWLHPTLSLWPLVLAWLAPMALLSALAFLLSTFALDPGLSMMMSMFLWTLLHLRRLSDWGLVTRPMPDLTAPALHPWLLTAALLVASVALWRSGREERWLA